MIVYSGKQYGNNFNNGDEGLFQDADRPRDSNMFKIWHGIQTRRQDLRTANSGIAAQGTFYGLKAQAGQATIQDPNTGAWLFNTAYMKNKYSAADFSWLPSAEENAKALEAKIIGRPYVSASDGDIVVGKSGIYAVTCQVRFIALESYNPKIISTTFSTSSAFYKFYVAFLLNGLPSMYTQGRGCGGQDTYSVSYVGWMDTGDRLNVGFLHTDTEDTFYVQPTINLYRLS